MKDPRWSLAAALCLTITCSCTGESNSGQYQINPNLATEVPWANGVRSQLYTSGKLKGQLDAPTSPFFPPIGMNLPDTGPVDPIDCSGLTDIELSPFQVETFEADPTVPNSVGVGETWSNYDDGTYGSFRTPGDASWYPDLVGRYSAVFGLSADAITNGPECDGMPNHWAMHLRAGRFNYYGGGAENPLGAVEPCPPGSDFCPPPPAPEATTDSAGFPLKAANGMDYEQQPPHQYWDVSLYDGVSFWARRGPNGETGMLVALQDKHTSDALNRQNQTFCQRIKTCRVECLSGLPCAISNPGVAADPTDPRSGPVYRCFDPTVGMAPLSEPAEIEMVYPVCGASACRSPDYYVDPDFDGTTCKPYDLTGANSGLFCFGDTPPPLPADECGDGWVAPVTLTPNWQLYTIPFTQFRQVGFAKPAPYFDLHSIYEFAIQLPVGSSDVWVDNISFYRRR